MFSQHADTSFIAVYALTQPQDRHVLLRASQLIQGGFASKFQKGGRSRSFSSWKFRKSDVMSASYLRICTLDLVYWALRQNSVVCNDVRTELTVFGGPVAKY